MRPATLPATSAFLATASQYLSEGLSDSHFVAGNPGHASTQGAAFYAQDFTSDISVCIVSGHRHGTKHGFSYTKPGDTEHIYKHESGYNQHTTRNNFNNNRNSLLHNRVVRFDGNIANQPARKHHEWHSVGNSGNTRSRRERRIGNRRDHGFHADTDWNFDHRGTVYAFQQRQHINDGEQRAFIWEHVRNVEQWNYQLGTRVHHDSIVFAERDISHCCRRSV